MGNLFKKYGSLFKSILLLALFCRISLALGSWNPLDWQHSKLGHLTILQAKQSYGTLKINQGIGGETLEANGVVYSKGVGTHANSRIEVIISGSDKGLTGSCVYPSFASGARIRCQIYDAEHLIHQTKDIDKDKRIANFSINIPDSRRITLVTKSLDFGIDTAHVAWVNLETYK